MDKVVSAESVIRLLHYIRGRVAYLLYHITVYRIGLYRNSLAEQVILLEFILIRKGIAEKFHEGLNLPDLASDPVPSAAEGKGNRIYPGQERVHIRNDRCGRRSHLIIELPVTLEVCLELGNLHRDDIVVGDDRIGFFFGCFLGFGLLGGF